jgi:GNAT superfamily N-acetyltransferase
MIVRLAMPHEEDALVELARMCVAEGVPHITFVEQRVRETFQRYLKTARPTFFFAEDRGRIVGFMQAHIGGYDFADGIFTAQDVLFVHPDKRGSRAAALLMANFVSWSDQLGALENRGGNDNGLTSERTARFLGKFGFEKVGYFVRRIRGA